VLILERRFVDEIIAHARAEGLKILPVCSYVVKVFAEDPSVQDVAARR
jgi:predicted GNAT family acetyltransferase